MTINVFCDEKAARLTTAAILGQFKAELADAGIQGEVADNLVELLAGKLVNDAEVTIGGGQ